MAFAIVRKLLHPLRMSYQTKEHCRDSLERLNSTLVKYQIFSLSIIALYQMNNSIAFFSMYFIIQLLRGSFSVLRVQMDHMKWSWDGNLVLAVRWMRLSFPCHLDSSPPDSLKEVCVCVCACLLLSCFSESTHNCPIAIHSLDLHVICNDD